MAEAALLSAAQRPKVLVRVNSCCFGVSFMSMLPMTMLALDTRQKTPACKLASCQRSYLADFAFFWAGLSLCPPYASPFSGLGVAGSLGLQDTQE